MHVRSPKSSWQENDAPPLLEDDDEDEVEVPPVLELVLPPPELDVLPLVDPPELELLEVDVPVDEHAAIASRHAEEKRVAFRVAEQFIRRSFQVAYV